MRIVLLGTLLIAFAACEKAAEKAVETASGGEVDVKGKTVTIKGDDGKTVTVVGDQGKGEAVAVVTDKEGTVAAFGGTKVPEGFPLPVFEGAKIGMGAKAAKDGANTYSVTLVVEGKPAQEVADFYEKALTEKGLKVKKNAMKMPGMEMYQLSGTKDGVTAQVVVNPGGGDALSVMLNWTEK